MPSASPMHRDEVRVVELRQYTLHPGRRDELIRLFEHEFVETQEAAGIVLLGSFTDLDDPDRFVWLRGFADMPARAEALQRFYGGPAWQAHRDAANATMRDSDDVLLLRPVSHAPRPQRSLAAGRVFVAAVLPWRGAPADPMQPASALAEAGATPVAVFETEPSPNNFPRLPVREGDAVRVVLAVLADVQASLRCQRALQARLPQGSQVLRLAPTPRFSHPE